MNNQKTENASEWPNENKISYRRRWRDVCGLAVVIWLGSLAHGMTAETVSSSAGLGDMDWRLRIGILALEIIMPVGVTIGLIVSGYKR